MERRSRCGSRHRNDLLGFSFGWRPSWERCRAKEFIARHDLERIALQEIRAFPGCEHVTDVEIGHQIDPVLKTNWTLHVYTCEGANMERIQYAINTTRQRLRHRYDLRRELSS
jgi:hypothetical protein